MAQRLRDPIAADARKAVASRRAGRRVCVSCPRLRPDRPVEDRPEALLTDRKPVICYECMLILSDLAPIEPDHPAGRHNSDVTVPVAANDHRAILSINQYDWPQPTLRNPDGSPLLAAAAALRGFANIVNYLLDQLIMAVALLLEALDIYLRKQLGPKWWLGTDIARWTPPWPK